MTRTSRTAGSTALVMIAVMPWLLSPAACPALPPPDVQWIELDAGAFLYYSSIPEDETREIANRMESFQRELFQVERSRRTERASVPTIVFVFRDVESLGPYNMGKGFAGYFSAGEDVNYIALSQSPLVDPMPLVYHEFVHYHLSRNFAVLPTWLNEGLAEFYSTYRERRNDIQVGRPDPMHLRQLRNQGLIPLSQLFETDSDSPLYNETSRVGVFYAQSWLLVHFLLIETEGGAGKIEEFLVRLEAGEDHDDALTDVVGYELPELERRIADYLDRKSMSFWESVREATGDRQELPIRPVPRAEILGRLGELLLTYGGERRGPAERHFEEALRLDPASPIAHRGHGQLEAARHDWDAALGSYLSAMTHGPEDYLTCLRLGRHFLEPLFSGPVAFGAGETPAKVTESRRYLQRAVTLRPDCLEARLWFGYSYLFDPGDPAQGIEILESLLPFYPSRPELSQNLLLLHLKAGDRQAAYRTVQDLLERGAGTRELQRSRETIAYHSMDAAQKLFTGGDREGGRGLLAEIRRNLEGTLVSPKLETDLASMENMFDRMEREEIINTRHATYLQARTLSSERQYVEALVLLEELLETDLDASMRAAVEGLADLTRYNRAVQQFDRGDYSEALELARRVAVSDQSDELRDLADLIVAACERKLGRRSAR